MRARNTLAMLVAAIALIATPGVGHAARAKPPSGYTIVTRGVWTQNPCAVTSAEPDVDAMAFGLECTGTATYRGQLDGIALQEVSGTAYADGSFATSEMTVTVYARLAQNLCGSFEIAEMGSIDATGTMYGTGPIRGISGDLADVTGSYEAMGYSAGGVGTGGFEITLKFPKKPVPAERPCVPPAPTS